MGKVMLFADIPYDGNYRCFDRNKTVKIYKQNILFNNVGKPVQISSVMNIQTDNIFISFVLTKNTIDSEKYVNIEFDMPDLRMQYGYTR